MKPGLNRSKLLPIAVAISFVIVVLIFFSINPTALEYSFESLSLHIFFEEFGACLSIIISILFILKYKNITTNVTNSIELPLASGFFIFGILEGIHGCLPLGNVFVWFNFVGFMLSSIMFSMLWFKRSLSPTSAIIIPGIFSIVVILFSLLLPTSIPRMYHLMSFNNVAIIMNSVSGLVFLSIVIYFLVTEWKVSFIQNSILLNFFVFQVISAFLFPFSRIWGLDWWSWHFLRFLSLCIVMIYMLSTILQLQKNLQKSEMKFRTLFDAANDGIFFLRPDGSFFDVNKAAHEVLGYTKEELLALSIAQIEPPELWATFPARMDKILSAGHATYETANIRKDGQIIPLEVNATLIDIGEEKLLLGIKRDITERKKTELEAIRSENALKIQSQELIKVNEELVRSNKELDDFAYIASHDLKEPLRSISNFSSFLLEDYQDKLDDDGKRKLNVLIDQSNRLEKFLSALLRYSRVGRTKVRLESVDINEIFEAIKQDLDYQVHEQRGCAIKILPDNKLPTLPCDPVFMKEILMNLISNAIKYNDKNEKIITLGYLEKSQALFVHDNGIGIREKHFEDIFKIFKRLHGRDKYGGGIGAGLTIVKKLIEAHNGKIWVESQPGVGSTFYFTINGGKV